MMKNLIILNIILISLFTSCLPDEDVIPDTDDPRDKIVDTWDCAEISPTYGETNYMVDISKYEDDDSEVVLSNFYGLGAWSSLSATMSGFKLTISSQTIEGHLISGNGTISSNYKTINWTYEVIELNKSGNDEKFSETVTATYTR